MQKLTRRLLILLVLVAALSSTSPVEKANASYTCEEQCQAQYEYCAYYCTSGCSPGQRQRCFETYTACVDSCPLK
jgi:hypothetical protein